MVALGLVLHLVKHLCGRVVSRGLVHLVEHLCRGVMRLRSQNLVALVDALCVRTLRCLLVCHGLRCLLMRGRR